MLDLGAAGRESLDLDSFIIYSFSCLWYT